MKTKDLYEVAVYVTNADKSYLSQSATLAIAQGLGKEYEMELEPSHINMVPMGTKNETIINPI